MGGAEIKVGTGFGTGNEVGSETGAWGRSWLWIWVAAGMQVGVGVDIQAGAALKAGAGTGTETRAGPALGAVIRGGGKNLNRSWPAARIVERVAEKGGGAGPGKAQWASA